MCMCMCGIIVIIIEQCQQDPRINCGKVLFTVKQQKCQMKYLSLYEGVFEYWLKKAEDYCSRKEKE